MSPGNGLRGSLFLLGATALENLGVEVDPINKKLKPFLAVIGGFLAPARPPSRACPPANGSQALRPLPRLPADERLPL